MEFQLRFVNLREPKLAILKIIENQKVNATLTVHVMLLGMLLFLF